MRSYPVLYSVLPLLTLFAGLVRADSITANPDHLVLATTPGGTVAATPITITSNPTSLYVTVAVNTEAQSWLQVSPSAVVTANGQGTFFVSCNCNSLSQGLYNATIQLSATGATTVTIPVSLTVGTSTTSGLGATPTSLAFTGQAGGVVPNSQSLAVTSSPSQQTFTVTASTTGGGSWLQASGIFVAPATVQVSVNTAGLGAGVYNGNIALAPGSSGTILNVPVTLTLTGGPVLSVNPGSLRFYYQIGSALPSSQTFDVTSNGSPIAFGVTAFTNDLGGWLSATPVSGSTKQTVTVSVSPYSLGAGTYTGQVTISSGAASNSVVAVPVTLTVSSTPLLVASAVPSTFVYQTGSQTPGAQSILISSTSTNFNFTVSTTTADGGGWLGAAPASGTTPQALSIAVSPSMLTAGNYSGTVSVSAAGISNSPLKIPVSLTVSTTGQLSLSVDSLNFYHQINGQNDLTVQPVGVYATGQSTLVTLSATTSSCGANWLAAYPPTFMTPQTITVTYSTSQVLSVAGNCQGTITLTANNGLTVVQLPVTLFVTTTPVMNVTPLWLNISAPFGGGVTASQAVTLSTSDNLTRTFSALGTANNGGNWLLVSPATGSAPGSFNVSAYPGQLDVGTYQGSVLIGSAALGTSQSIPVTFTVKGNFAASVTPLSLAFTQVSGVLAPATQTLTISTPNNVTAAFVATPTSGSTTQWISLSPVIGDTSAPRQVTVRVDGSALAPATYQGSVIFSVTGASNSPISIPITLTVISSQSISASPSSLSFTYQTGSAAPAGLPLNVTSVPAGLNVGAIASSTGNWLSVTPASVTAPGAFTVGVTPTGLAVGSYDGTITLSVAGANAVAVPVHLVVSTPSTAISAIANAASGARSAIAPGEIVTLGGTSLGPASGVGLRLDPSGKLVTTVAGTTVYFDSYAAPILYTSASQVNTIVPFEVAGQSTTQVVVQYQDARSSAYTMQLAKTAPGIFTVGQNGQGQGAILNQDGVTVNGAAAPAAKGSVVSIYFTGAGLMTSGNQTASVLPLSPLPTLNLQTTPVAVTIGGLAADLQYAGGAPGSVAGLYQINAKIPNSVASGPQAVGITVGGVAAQNNVTVYVQ